MKEQYSPDEASTYLQYLEVNSLYRWVMTLNLPTLEFAWENVDNFTPEKCINLLKQ